MQRQPFGSCRSVHQRVPWHTRHHAPGGGSLVRWVRQHWRSVAHWVRVQRPPRPTHARGDRPVAAGPSVGTRPGRLNQNRAARRRACEIARTGTGSTRPSPQLVARVGINFPAWLTHPRLVIRFCATAPIRPNSPTPSRNTVPGSGTAGTTTGIDSAPSTSPSLNGSPKSIS